MTSILTINVLRRIVAFTLAALLVAGAVSGVGTRAPIAPAIAIADDDDDDEDDNSGPGSDNSDSGSGGGDENDDDDNSGHGGGDDDDDGDDGDDDGDDEPSSRRTTITMEQPASLSDPFGVEVNCEWDSGSDRSTCEFIPIGGTAPITDLLIPATVACAAVTGGDFETDVPVPAHAEDVAFYSTRPGAVVAILIFAGKVRTSYTTTYWVETEIGRQPAAGPALACPDSATPPASPSPATAANAQTGSITVQAFTCGTAMPADPESFDWYGECAVPASNLTFDLFLSEGDRPVESIRSDKNGKATFPILNPGTYRLEQAESNWCHAESDRVTASGEVQTVAGEESLVWVFQCSESRGGA